MESTEFYEVDECIQLGAEVSSQRKQGFGVLENVREFGEQMVRVDAKEAG